MAAAYVLFELLRMNKSFRLSPLVLKEGDDIPDGASKALLICSTGCFHSGVLASWLIRITANSPTILPIIAEPDFAVPTEPKSAVAAVAGAFTDAEMATYAEAVGGIFQEIASVLAPQSYSSTQAAWVHTLGGHVLHFLLIIIRMIIVIIIIIIFFFIFFCFFFFFL